MPLPARTGASLHAALLAALLALPALLAVPLPPADAAAPSACPGPPAWFLGVVYDPAQRADFVKDVDNFELYLATLRARYCIPDAQATILAFEANYQRNGKTYENATEAAVKQRLAWFGAAAQQAQDPTLFFFLSSHGLLYATSSACPGRVMGSFSALKNGDFHDCELGSFLNGRFDPGTRMFVAVDCSFCGGFSDSLTAASGTLPNNTLPVSSGVPGPGRVVFTGCAITTECFGDDCGGVSYCHLKNTLARGLGYCDGWTAPGFPLVQGVDLPVKQAALHPPDGRCTASEWAFGAINSAYTSLDLIGIQQQFRVKYGLPSLADDIVIL